MSETAAGEMMSLIHSVLSFDEKPPIPDGWRICCKDQITSRVTGHWTVDITRVKLILDSSQVVRRQVGDRSVPVDVSGEVLLQKLDGHAVLPAHLIHFLLSNPDAIPEDWDRYGNPIFFWGTIFRDQHGVRKVAFITKFLGTWGMGYRDIDNDVSRSNFDTHCLCAVLT